MDALGKSLSVVMLRNQEGRIATVVDRGDLEEGANVLAGAGTGADSQSAIGSALPGCLHVRHRPKSLVNCTWTAMAECCHDKHIRKGVMTYLEGTRSMVI